MTSGVSVGRSAFRWHPIRRNAHMSLWHRGAERARRVADQTQPPAVARRTRGGADPLAKIGAPAPADALSPRRLRRWNTAPNSKRRLMLSGAGDRVSACGFPQPDSYNHIDSLLPDNLTVRPRFRHRFLMFTHHHSVALICWPTLASPAPCYAAIAPTRAPVTLTKSPGANTTCTPRSPALMPMRSKARALRSR